MRFVVTMQENVLRLLMGREGAHRRCSKREDRRARFVVFDCIESS